MNRSDNTPASRQGLKAIYPDVKSRTVLMCGGATGIGQSVADGIVTQAGDRFEIEAPDFGLTLRNPLQVDEPHDVEVQLL